jgi:hypothetical protein
MSRSITIVGLIQLTLVLLGFFALGIILRVEGYPHDPPFMASLGRVVWSPTALFLRNHGLLLLFVPAVWTTVASLSQNRRVFFSLAVWLIIGVALSGAITTLFIYACTHRYAVVPN